MRRISTNVAAMGAAIKRQVRTRRMVVIFAREEGTRFTFMREIQPRVAEN